MDIIAGSESASFHFPDILPGELTVFQVSLLECEFASVDPFTLYWCRTGSITSFLLWCMKPCATLVNLCHIHVLIFPVEVTENYSSTPRKDFACCMASDGVLFLPVASSGADAQIAAFKPYPGSCLASFWCTCTFQWGWVKLSTIATLMHYRNFMWLH